MTGLQRACQWSRLRANPRPPILPIAQVVAAAAGRLGDCRIRSVRATMTVTAIQDSAVERRQARLPGDNANAESARIGKAHRFASDRARDHFSRGTKPWRGPDAGSPASGGARSSDRSAAAEHSSLSQAHMRRRSAGGSCAAVIRPCARRSPRGLGEFAASRCQRRRKMPNLQKGRRSQTIIRGMSVPAEITRIH